MDLSSLHQKLADLAFKNTEKPSQLKEKAKILHAGYQKNTPISTVDSYEAAVAYATSRMPATTTVLKRCLQEIPHPDLITTACDIGSGTGAFLWAVESSFQNLKKITLIEKNNHMTEVAKALIPSSIAPTSLQFLEEDLLTLRFLPKADLLSLSYVTNELSPKTRETLISLVWEAATHYILILNPGTPHVHHHHLWIREKVAQLGGYIIAPCGSNEPCPLSKEKWCHFGLRLPRSKLQKYLKEGQAPFENEKYSYLLISKASPSRDRSRIITPPEKTKRGLSFVSCSKGHLSKTLLTKQCLNSAPSLKKIKWGDSYKTESEI